MPRVKAGIGGSFDDYMDQVWREAEVEGTDAVAQMRAYSNFYRLLGDFMSLRLENKLTQKQLERLTGIPQAEISRVETGQANPTLSTLHRLVLAMDGEIRITPRSGR